MGTPHQALATTYGYTLYGNGMVQTETVTAPSPGGADKVTTNYDTHGNVTSVVDGLGHTTTYTGYSGLGEPAHVTGANGDVTDYTYDARGRVATKTTHPFGSPSTWTYSYDGFGLLSKVVDYDGTTTWTRNPYMQVTSITHDDRDGTSTESFGYDANGDVTSDVTARGSDIGKSSTLVYDALGRVYQRKGNHGQVLTYAYDGNGNVLSITDALNHQTSHHYDALNRLSETIDAKTGTTYYYYDADDHLTKVIDPRGLVTTYNWDGLGLLWKQVSPDTGTTTFSYDGYARLASKTRADSVQSTYSYDTLNRVTKISAGGLNQTFAYDTCTDGKGRLCLVSDSHTTTAYSYSAEGWVVGRGFTVGTSTYALGFSYDQVGRPTVVYYPDGNTASYYNYKGSVFQVALNIGGTASNAATNIAYRPGNLAMSSWTSGNGLTNTITYDNDLRPTSIVVPGVEAMSYSYDAADQMTTLNDGSFAPAMQQGFAYDELGRLYTVRSGADNEDLRYDADGNRVLGIRNGVTTNYYPASNSNRLDHQTTGSTTVNYAYDAQGNLKSSTGGPSFSYDAFNRMSAASSTSYDVNPEGQRLEKSNGAGTVYFAPDMGGTLQAENTGGQWTDYVWLNGRPIALIRNGVAYSIHSNHLGRAQAVTRPDQYTVWVAENYPYDRKVMTDLLGGMNLGFPGQYNDVEDGLWYNGARDYDSNLGRYIESDPIGLTGGINTYAYANSNPISNVDPLGTDSAMFYTGPYQSGTGGSACADSGGGGGSAVGLVAMIIATEIAGLGPADPVADAAVAAEIEESGVTVLGSYPEYVEVAQQTGANYFSVPADEWAQMSAGDQWAANKAFLDQAIERGGTFQFSNEFAPAGSSYERELQYLQQRGVFSAVPPGG